MGRDERDSGDQEDEKIRRTRHTAGRNVKVVLITIDRPVIEKYAIAQLSMISRSLGLLVRAWQPVRQILGQRLPSLEAEDIPAALNLRVQ